MKNLFSTFVIVLVFNLSMGAQNIQPTFEKLNDLVKATYYYTDGSIKEIGFFKGDQLHDQWISYDEKGNIKVMANYHCGKKEGTWYFKLKNSTKEVVFKENHVIRVKELKNWDPSII